MSAHLRASIYIFRIEGACRCAPRDPLYSTKLHAFKHRSFVLTSLTVSVLHEEKSFLRLRLKKMANRSLLYQFPPFRTEYYQDTLKTRSKNLFKLISTTVTGFLTTVTDTVTETKAEVTCPAVRLMGAPRRHSGPPIRGAAAAVLNCPLNAGVTITND